MSLFIFFNNTVSTGIECCPKGHLKCIFNSTSSLSLCAILSIRADEHPRDKTGNIILDFVMPKGKDSITEFIIDEFSWRVYNRQGIMA